MRLFIAVATDEAVRARLSSFADEARDAAGRDATAWRFVRPEGLHLTMQFLGDAPEAALDGLRQAMARAAARATPLDAELRGAGAFPSATRPQVLWAGVRGGADALAWLAADLGRELAPLGFPPEDRPFQAHLTLARAKDARRARLLGSWIGRQAERDFGVLPVRELVLFQSRLGPGGSVYARVAGAALGA